MLIELKCLINGNDSKRVCKIFINPNKILYLKEVYNCRFGRYYTKITFSSSIEKEDEDIKIFPLKKSLFVLETPQQINLKIIEKKRKLTDEELKIKYSIFFEPIYFMFENKILPTYVMRILIKYGINTFGELCQLSHDKLKQINGLARKSLKHIKENLMIRNLHLNQSIPEEIKHLIKPINFKDLNKEQELTEKQLEEKLKQKYKKYFISYEEIFKSKNSDSLGQKMSLTRIKYSLFRSISTKFIGDALVNIFFKKRKLLNVSKISLSLAEQRLKEYDLSFDLDKMPNELIKYFSKLEINE